MDRPILKIISPAWDAGWWGEGKKVLAPPLALPVLASLTPLDIDVQLIDENVEPTNTDTPVDWVAISCMTASAPRAYALANIFRDRGVPVVMGGIHPSFLPDEAAAHADAIVIGEAEPLWPEVIRDLKANQLKPRYNHDGYCELAGLPLPRRNLLQADRYLTINVVQTARGCPNACTFCTVSAFTGRSFRFRPVREVINELCSLGGGWIGFIDDNITGNPNRAKELFEALIPLKRRWVGQADLNIARDPELLSLAARSGCHALFIGLESVSNDNLRTTHKAPNVGKDMSAAIRAIHKAGIEIIGSFVLGLDGDDKTVFAKTLDFAMRHKLVAAQFSVLTPFPGTVMREQLVRDGRVLTNDWALYTMSNVVFRPKQMTPQELSEGQQWDYKRFYSLPSIFKRSLTKRDRWVLRIAVNLAYRGVRRGKGLHSMLPKHQDDH